MAAHRARHDDLLDGRLAGDGGRAEGAVVGGHLAPAQDLQVELGEGALEVVADAAVACAGSRGRKHCADRVVAGSGQRDAQLRALAQEEGVRQLHEDAGAVAGVLLRAARTAVVEVDEHVDALPDDVVASDVVEVGHEADTACVVLEAWVVESLLRLRVVHGGVLRGRGEPRGPATRRIPPASRGIHLAPSLARG